MSPPGWRGNPYVMPSGLQVDKKTGSKIVRVLVHKSSQPKPFKGSVKIVCNGQLQSGGFTQKLNCFHYPLNSYLTFKGKKYTGSFYLYREENMVHYVNHIPLDQYIASVLSYEMNPAWPLEALKAQAVAARTYLYNKLSQKKTVQYDISNTTNHQVYGGLAEKMEPALRASRETGSEVLLYQGKLAQVFFHSSCGGISAASEEVWSNQIPYLSSKKQSFCNRSPAYTWKTTMSAAQLQRKLGIDGIQGISVIERTRSQRVKSIEITHSKGVTRMNSSEFRRKLGNSSFKSTLFTISGNRKNITFKGRGYGHGVGLCQWGAKYMAGAYNRNYTDILSQYFPGTNLSSL